MSETTTDTPAGGARAAAGRRAYRARIERVFDHNGDTRSLGLKIIDGGALSFAAGQFISITIPLAEGQRVRPYTIASDPADGGVAEIEICFNRVADGRGVDYLFGLGIGDPVSFTGPFGIFCLDHVPPIETVFIAEGTAIAPVRPMLKRVYGNGGDGGAPIHLLYAARDAEHILYRAELEALAARGLDFATLVAPADRLYERIGAEVARRWIEADSNRRRLFYACGVGKGVIALRDILRGAGYDRRAVHYERW